MTRWLASWTLVTATLFGWSGTTYAQILPQLEINVFGSGSYLTRNQFEIGFPQSVTPIDAKFRLDDSFGGGVRFNVHTGGHWGEEFFYSFESSEAHFTRETPPQGQLDLGTQIHNLGVNGLYYFNSDDTARTRPFLSFGVGATIYRPTADAKAIANDPLRGNLPGYGQSNEFAFNYGAGFKRRIAGIYGVRVDVRHVRHFLGRNPSFSLPRHSNDPNATVFPATGAISNFEASAGIVFYFSR
jgi:hypothetical protein